MDTPETSANLATILAELPQRYDAAPQIGSTVAHVDHGWVGIVTEISRFYLTIYVETAGDLEGVEVKCNSNFLNVISARNSSTVRIGDVVRHWSQSYWIATVKNINVNSVATLQWHTGPWSQNSMSTVFLIKAVTRDAYRREVLGDLYS